MNMDAETSEQARRFLRCLQAAKEVGEWPHDRLADTYDIWCDHEGKCRVLPWRAIARELKQEYGVRSYLRVGDRKTVLWIPDEIEEAAYRARPRVMLPVA